MKKFPWRQGAAFFCAALVCTALWAEVQQSHLAEGIIRLHVIANSDDPRDQALKLQVRDGVLLQAEGLLEGAADPQEAASVLEDHLSSLAHTAAQSAREAGQPCSVRVTLEETWFPTRQYGDLTLPAGEYQALRVILGEGLGKNWWCVVFPSLSLPAVTEQTAPVGAFTPQGSSLLIPEDSYVFRFKALEWWGICKGWFAGQR